MGWEELYTQGKRDISRYIFISEYYRDNPERIMENVDRISDIMFAVLNLYERDRVGFEEDIEDLRKNFGIEKIRKDSNTRYFVFKERIPK